MKYEVIPLVILLKNIYIYLIADLLNYKYECKEKGNSRRILRFNQFNFLMVFSVNLNSEDISFVILSKNID